MVRTRSAARWLFVAMLAAGPAAAQELFVFPQQGQSQAQQDQDRGACHVWAVNQTGFDPTLASTTPPSSREAPQGALVRGGARGAAAGAVMGAIGGNAGRGAAMGAAGGGVIGGMRRSDQARRQQQGSRNWQAQQDAQRANYRRALTACLEGKGYTVR
jgi:hypothetical protein